LRGKGNLRGKRRDPWHRVNAPPQAVAAPALSGQDAMPRKRVLTWFAGWWRNHPPKRAEKPHSRIPAPQGPGRPCYEAGNSALPRRIASGSRQPSVAPNAGTGKRAWRTPTPDWSLCGRKTAQGPLLLLACRSSGAQSAPGAAKALFPCPAESGRTPVVGRDQGGFEQAWVNQHGSGGRNGSRGFAHCRVRIGPGNEQGFATRRFGMVLCRRHRGPTEVSAAHGALEALRLGSRVGGRLRDGPGGRSLRKAFELN